MINNILLNKLMDHGNKNKEESKKYLEINANKSTILQILGMHQKQF